jgi:phosphatidate cytidylyltransferase
MMLIIGIMTLEYFRITLGNSHIWSQYITIVCGWLLFFLFYLLMYHHIQGIWFLLLVFPISMIWILLLFQKSDIEYAKAPHLFVPIIYIALPFSLTNLLAFDALGNFDGFRLLSLFIILWCSDVGAYTIGMSFGQKNGHKLFPRISPKKSWEGFVGGLLFALLAGFLIHRIGWLPYPLIHCFAISLLLHLFGVGGDLAESQLKRHFEVKDSGKIMPGHGGLLDRFDSAILAFPVVIAYIKLLSL